MKKNKLCLLNHIKIRMMTLMIAFAVQAQAQNSFVSWSSFNMGFSESKTSNTMVKSVVGQNFVGTSQQTNTQAISGFLADTLFRSVLVAMKERKVLPAEYSLSQNYPNPFNPVTTIRYDLPMASHVSITFYNIVGQQVATLVNEIQEAGYKSVQWNAFSFPSGVYMFRIQARQIDGGQASNFIQTKKLVLMK